MGIRQITQFQSRLEWRRRNPHGLTLHVRSPLNRSPHDERVGWTTELEFPLTGLIQWLESGRGEYTPKPSDWGARPYSVGRAVRTTTFVSAGKKLRRAMVEQYATEDKLEVSTFGWTFSSWSAWRPRGHSARDYTHLGNSGSGVKFDVAELDAFLVKVHEQSAYTRAEPMAQPFVEWLAENTEFGPLINEPGWLAKAELEFLVVKQQRDEEYKRKTAAVKDADSSEERWR